MGATDSPLSASYTVALFLLGKGFFPLSAKVRDEKTLYLFPDSARDALAELGAARRILDGLGTMAGKSTGRESVVEFLRTLLADGPKTAAEVQQAAMDACVTIKDLRSPEVAEAAGVVKEHPDPAGPWIWRLREGAGQ